MSSPRKLDGLEHIVQVSQANTDLARTSLPFHAFLIGSAHRFRSGPVAEDGSFPLDALAAATEFCKTELGAAVMPRILAAAYRVLAANAGYALSAENTKP